MAQDYRENLFLALDTLRAHKLRSFLTVLGVVIGVAVIMLVAALLTGFDQTVTEAITGYGADTAFISRFDFGPRVGRRPKEERERKPLTLEDGEAIMEQCPAVKQVTVWIVWWEQPHKVRYKDSEVVGIEFRGAFPNFPQVYDNATMKQGRFFTQAENLHREKVVVVGEDVSNALFPNLEAVGKELLIDGSSFLVIGVFEKPKGGFGGNDEDKRVIIPYYTFRKVYPAAYEQNIRIQAEKDKLDLAVDQARDVLLRRRNVAYDKPDTFSIQTSQQAVEQFHAIVGMMNIMLVSVTERTREIGVRKAIGARRRDVVWQFLLEAMTLTGIGGILGMLLAGGVVILVRAATEKKDTVPLWAVIAGFTVSITIGLIFGVWPAMKAARLDPVDALRYE